MKHLKLFFALFAMLALGVGNAWGEKITDYSKIGTGKTYYIGATTGGTDYYLSVSGASASNSTVAGTAVTDKTKAATFVFTGSGTSWTIKFADYANYLSLSSSKANGKVMVVSSAATFTASTQSQKLRLSKDGYSIQKNNSGTQFGSYANTQTDIWLEEVPGSSEPTTTYTIKWHTAKGVTTDVTLNEGATITKPTTDPTMTGYEFMGWTEDCAVASDGTGFTAISNFGTATEDKDYYAVFAVATTTSGEGSSNYEKVTSNLTDWAGDYLIAYNNTTFADGRTGGTSGMGAQNKKVDLSSSLSNNTIPASVGDQYNVTLEAVSGGYVLKTKDGQYNYQSSNDNGLKVTTNISTATTYAIKVTFTSENDIKLALSGGANGAVFRYNTSGYFRFYKNGGQSAVYLYKKVAGGSTTTYSDYITTCASDIEFVELGDDFKWSATEAEVTINATDNVFPTLTNTHNVPVKYSSSDDAIASIASDGTVTLNKEGSVTITAKYAGGTSAGTDKEYKAKTVTYSLKVNKAVAQPTGTMYVKVTDAVTDGEYLIVYEAGNVAFDGSLATLDVAGNMIEAQINSNTIAGNTEIDAATFTIASMEGGHSIQSKSGTYIGRTSGSNGMNTGNSAIANVITFSNGAVKVAGSGSGASASLQYYAQSGSERFRYYATAQKAIALYKKVDPNAVVEPAFTPVAGEYYGTQSVTISCATAGAEVYYTLDGTDPTSTSTKYTGAISITATTTVKAVAIKGENSSAVVSATYTILAPLATMQAIFDKAIAVGGTATPVHITMNNWVVTGVKNNNVYVTDGTKGLIIYTASHGFNVGDILSGTVACKVQLYNGSSELTELTSTTEGLTVSTGGVVTPVVVNDVTTLDGVNTGSVIKITGPCTVDGTKYYVAGVQLYNSLYTYTNPEDGYNYECTGVYLQYNTTKEILPRKAEDLVKIETQQPAGIAFAVTELTAEVGATDFVEPELTNPNSLTVTYKTSDATLATVDATTGEVTIGNKAGKVTITASFAGSDDFVAADASYNITITDPSISTVTFDATIDKTPDAETLSLTKDVITMTFTGGAMNNGENYRCYKDQTLTISAIDASIQKIEFECTSSNPISGFADATGLDKTNSVWTGDAKSIELTASNKQVRMSKVNVYYKKDNRAETGLAWNPATVSLTVGDAFTAPTLSNPNNLTGITFASDNEALATVTNAGVISLVNGKTGTATITATYAGNETYKAAEITCVITVSPKSEKVVILAQLEGQWYAMTGAYVTDKTNVLAAIPVEYINGKLYNVAETDKASIEWQRSMNGNKATFKNGDNYLTGGTSGTDLTLKTIEFEWDYNGVNYLSGNETTKRTFLYCENTKNNVYGFKNFAISNAGSVKNNSDGTTESYSSTPEVVAPVYATATIYTREDLTVDNHGTICLPYGSSNYSGAEFYEVSSLEVGKGLWLDQLAAGASLEAGKPYIFKATAAKIAVAYEGAKQESPVAGVNGLTGTFTDIEANDVLVGNYIIAENQIWVAGEGATLPANRAYINATLVPKKVQPEIPGRRRVCMGENAATGFDNIVAPEGQAVKVIENGQLIIIRDGVKYNVQGQKL